MKTPASDRLEYRFSVAAQDFAAAGEASSKIRRILQQIGVRPEVIRRTSVATYEAEMNVVIHADGGEITLEAEPGFIIVTVADRGPGIEDVTRAMQPGYSTASEQIREMGFGAGMGLSNMERCSDEMSIDTEIGRGTTVKMCFNNSPESQ